MPQLPSEIMSTILLPEIYAVAESRGATISANQPVPKTLVEAPAFVIEYQVNIRWPKSKEFNVGIPDTLLSNVCLGGKVDPMPDDYELSNTGEMELFAIGVADGGNYILMIDGNDPNPANPIVYEMDHEVDPGDEVTKVCRLLEFFNSLES